MSIHTQKMKAIAKFPWFSLIMIAGLVAGLTLKDAPSDEEIAPRIPYWSEIREPFSLFAIIPLIFFRRWDKRLVNTIKVGADQ